MHVAWECLATVPTLPSSLTRLDIAGKAVSETEDPYFHFRIPLHFAPLRRRRRAATVNVALPAGLLRLELSPVARTLPNERVGMDYGVDLSPCALSIETLTAWCEKTRYSVGQWGDLSFSMPMGTLKPQSLAALRYCRVNMCHAAVLAATGTCLLELDIGFAWKGYVLAPLPEGYVPPGSPDLLTVMPPLPSTIERWPALRTLRLFDSVSPQNLSFCVAACPHLRTLHFCTDANNKEPVDVLSELLSAAGNAPLSSILPGQLSNLHLHADVPAGLVSARPQLSKDSATKVQVQALLLLHRPNWLYFQLRRDALQSLVDERIAERTHLQRRFKTVCASIRQQAAARDSGVVTQEQPCLPIRGPPGEPVAGAAAAAASAVVADEAKVEVVTPPSESKNNRNKERKKTMSQARHRLGAADSSVKLYDEICQGLRGCRARLRALQDRLKSVVTHLREYAVKGIVLFSPTCDGSVPVHFPTAALLARDLQPVRSAVWLEPEFGAFLSLVNRTTGSCAVIVAPDKSFHVSVTEACQDKSTCSCRQAPVGEWPDLRL
jgi:hypothetical protein